MYKANIQGNQEQGSRYPRLIGSSTWNNREEGLGFCAESWWGWFVLREGTPPNKGKQGQTRGNQGQTRANKGKQRKTREIKGKQGKPKENKEKQGKPLQSTKEIPSNQWEYLQSIGFLSKQGQYFTVKWKRKAIASDGGYSVIGGRYCLLVWE